MILLVFVLLWMYNLGAFYKLTRAPKKKKNHSYFSGDA